MLCPKCQAGCSEDDLYCRQCGTDLTIPSTSLVPIQRNLPVIGRQLPRLAAGAGALAVGVGLELLRRSLLARITRSPQPATEVLPTLGSLRDILKPENSKSKEVKLPQGYEVHETVVYMRRVIRRQS